MMLLILIALVTLSFVSCIVITTVLIDYINQWYEGEEEEEEEDDNKLFNNDLEDK
jgi:hypothetical protein